MKQTKRKTAKNQEKKVKEKCLTTSSKTVAIAVKSSHSCDENDLINIDDISKYKYRDIKTEPRDLDEMKATLNKVTEGSLVGKVKSENEDCVENKQTDELCDPGLSGSDHTSDLSGDSDTNSSSSEIDDIDDAKTRKQRIKPKAIKQTLKGTYGKRRYKKCPVEGCTYECTTARAMSEHLEKKHNDLKPHLGHKFKRTRKSLMLKCPVEKCDFRYRGKRRLERHLDSVHSGEKPFPCTQPGMSDLCHPPLNLIYKT